MNFIKALSTAIQTQQSAITIPSSSSSLALSLSHSLSRCFPSIHPYIYVHIYIYKKTDTQRNDREREEEIGRALVTHCARFQPQFFFHTLFRFLFYFSYSTRRQQQHRANSLLQYLSLHFFSLSFSQSVIDTQKVVFLMRTYPPPLACIHAHSI